MTASAPVRSTRRPDIVVSLPDGRSLVAADYGDVTGPPVVALHGTPGSRLMLRPAAAHALGLGARLIVPDRPGCGLSTPDRNLTLRSFADDVRALLDALGIAHCGLLGISGGGPYAVAAAAVLGDRASRLVLVSPVGPLAEHVARSRLSFVQRRLFFALGQQRVRARLAAALGIALLRNAPAASYAAFARALGPADQAILTAPGWRDHVLADAFEGLRQGSGAALRDLALFARPWQVDFSSIRIPTVIWHGTEDRMVPFAGAEALARLLPDAQFRPIANAGHFWIYANLAAVVGEVAHR